MQPLMQTPTDRGGMWSEEIEQIILRVRGKALEERCWRDVLQGRTPDVFGSTFLHLRSLSLTGYGLFLAQSLLSSSRLLPNRNKSHPLTPWEWFTLPMSISVSSLDRYLEMPPIKQEVFFYPHWRLWGRLLGTRGGSRCGRVGRTYSPSDPS